MNEFYCLYKMAKSSTTFWDYFLASVITGTTVMIMQGIFEGMFMFAGTNSMLIRLLLNLLVSGASGFVAIMLVDATNLLA